MSCRSNPAGTCALECATHTAATFGCASSHRATRSSAARDRWAERLQHGSSRSSRRVVWTSAASNCTSTGSPSIASRSADTVPTWRRRSASTTPDFPRRLPKRRMSNAYERGESPVTSARSVVFPLPFGPRKTHRSPSQTVQEKSLNSTRCPNARSTPRISTTGLGFPDCARTPLRRFFAHETPSALFRTASAPSNTSSVPNPRMASGRAHILSRQSGSSPLKGSRTTSRSGHLSNARARSTRRISPLERDEKALRSNGFTSSASNTTPFRTLYPRLSAACPRPTSNGLISKTDLNDSMSDTRSPSSSW